MEEGRGVRKDKLEIVFRLQKCAVKMIFQKVMLENLGIKFEKAPNCMYPDSISSNCLFKININVCWPMVEMSMSMMVEPVIFVYTTEHRTALYEHLPPRVVVKIMNHFPIQWKDLENFKESYLNKLLIFPFYSVGKFMAIRVQ